MWKRNGNKYDYENESVASTEKTKMVGLLNLLDANELETKLKEVGIG